MMTVEEIYDWDLAEMAQKVFGTLDLRHPLVAEMHRWGPREHLGPSAGAASCPPHYDFKELRLTPAQTRARLRGYGPQQRRRLPDAQPAAPRARGTDQTGHRRRSTARCCCIRWWA